MCWDLLFGKERNTRESVDTDKVVSDELAAIVWDYCRHDTTHSTLGQCGRYLKRQEPRHRRVQIVKMQIYQSSFFKNYQSMYFLRFSPEGTQKLKWLYSKEVNVHFNLDTELGSIIHMVLVFVGMKHINGRKIRGLMLSFQTLLQR